MSKEKIPPITGKHHAFAVRFRRALEWANVLAYDSVTGERKGSYRKAGERLGGLSGQFIADLYKGEQLPSGAKGIDIANKLGVSHNWLVSGEGAMVADRMVSIDHLNDEDQALVLSMIKSLEQKTKKGE